MSRKSYHFTLDEEIFRSQAAELSDAEIAEIYGCSVVTVGRWRDRYGIPRSQAKPWVRHQVDPRERPQVRERPQAKPRTHAHKRHPALIDNRFFACIDTPEKAYILGFLIADGHVYKSGNRVEVGTKEADSALLRAIADAMGSDAPLRTMINSYNGSRYIRITVGGTRIAEDLAALGLRNDKSVSAVYPSIRPDLEGHLVRGIWDGDGWVGKYQFELIGTSAVLDGVVDAAIRHTGCELRRRMSGKDGRYHYAYGTRRDTAILHWMYKDATIALERKREKFQMYWSEIPSAESLNLRIGPRVYTRKDQVRSAADYPSAG